MNNHQLPLANVSASDIAHPQFSSSAAGGPASQWVQSHGLLALFRTVLVVAIILIIRSFWSTTEQEIAPSPTPQLVATVSITVSSGQGANHIAAAAFQQASITFSAAEERLYAIAQIAKLIGSSPLFVGDVVSLPRSTLEAAQMAASQMSASERAAWRKLVR
jgi:hypothetical protein